MLPLRPIRQFSWLQPERRRLHTDFSRAKKNPVLAPMIDIHCHILPGIDDGSPSWEITAEMCRMAAEDGVRHIVATPHANERFFYDRSRYEGMLQKLRNVGCGIKFSLGCDFHFSFDNIEDAVLHPRRYTIGGS